MHRKGLWGFCPGTCNETTTNEVSRSSGGSNEQLTTIETKLCELAQREGKRNQWDFDTLSVVNVRNKGLRALIKCVTGHFVVSSMKHMAK